MVFTVGRLADVAYRGVSGQSKQASLSQFITKMSSYGVQLGCRFEVTFPEISDFTFFAQSISTPGMRQNMGSLNYAGVEVRVPINSEFEHDVSITMINDSSGYVYPTILDMLQNGAKSKTSRYGFNVTITAIGDDYTNGMVLSLNNVVMATVSGLDYGQANADFQTFTIQCWCRDFSYQEGQEKGILGMNVGHLKDGVESLKYAYAVGRGDMGLKQGAAGIARRFTVGV